MTFKRHTMGRIEDRPVSEQFEAKFHQLLCPQLDRCVNMGNKKKQGYIMGAFREALADFRVLSPDELMSALFISGEEADILYSLVSNVAEELQNAAVIAELNNENSELYKLSAQKMSALKVKLMVRKLMEVTEVKDDVSGV